MPLVDSSFALLSILLLAPFYWRGRTFIVGGDSKRSRGGLWRCLGLAQSHILDYGRNMYYFFLRTHEAVLLNTPKSWSVKLCDKGYSAEMNFLPPQKSAASTTFTSTVSQKLP